MAKFRLRTRKRALRRASRKMMRRRMRRMVINRFPSNGDFPKMLKFKHIFASTKGISSSAGALTSNLYSCNSLYQADVTYGSHRPLRFDQIAAIYDHYTVIGAKATFKITNYSTASQYPVIAALWINDDTTSSAFASMSSIVEFSRSIGGKYVLMPCNANKTYKLSLGWSAKKYFGRSPLSDSAMRGTATTSPTERSYFQLSVGTADATNTTAIWYEVEIEYLTIWNEKADPAFS